MIAKAFDIVQHLGPGWVTARIAHALSLRSGWLKTQTPRREWTGRKPEIVGHFFAPDSLHAGTSAFDLTEAEAICDGRLNYFFNKKVSSPLPPDWFHNPLNGSNSDASKLRARHWTEISDFNHGDIKCIWELSRFAWVYPLVRAYQEGSKETYSQVFWKLLADWADHNPPNSGVHWKCGQEVSIRMFALVTGYFGFRNADSAVNEGKKLLSEMMFESAKRIEANIGYALSQRNNHGISEAAGLFTAGVLFGKAKWLDKGAKHLERQVKKLVYDDGSFSQHSANYHRVMLHACLWAIQIGRANRFEFSSTFTELIRNAGIWLLALYDSSTGRMPNLGSNDGALILPYSSCEYLDYRPTIQATGAVVDGYRWLPTGKWDDLAFWLVPGLGKARPDVNRTAHDHVGIQLARGRTGPNTGKESKFTGARGASLQMFRQGGYAVFTQNSTKLIFRCPEQFDHRPAQCDLMHVDLWAGGHNILRDAGTYSYNCDHPWQDYFKSTSAHNTIQFDQHDQMPKISRFLYGQWPKPDVSFSFDRTKLIVEAAFTDWKKCRHQRRVELLEDLIRITDTVSGYQTGGMLRWRLSPKVRWQLQDLTCRSELCCLDFSNHAGLAEIRITEGWESLYYQYKTRLPVLEMAFIIPCRKIVTDIRIISS